ncbi:MAG: DUF4105 domain-containing protein [Phocaeicola sp.]|nr:DUF4105 domain-containing protein [Phocaeicola sp.]
MKKFISLYILGILLSLQTMWAQEKDSLRFSLLTCAPGVEVYELFGHTAIRYENYSTGEDLVFNYGMFSFDAPNFLYRFVKGETDYELGVVPYAHFEQEYRGRGTKVYTQELNLTSEEKLRLLYFLLHNAEPTQSTYRYNYFYDNCTTRARDAIESIISGQVIYPDRGAKTSFRKIVHKHLETYPWEKFGIDFCLGETADKRINSRLQMFAPFHTKQAFQTAYIISTKGDTRPLLLSEKLLIDVEDRAHKAPFFTPLLCMSLFFLLNLFIAWYQWKKKTILKFYDFVLYGIQGIMGCIIAFLFFFSIHPTVGTNWLICVFNPIPLLFVFWIHFLSTPLGRKRYFIANTLWLTMCLFGYFFVPQHFNLAVLPLVLSFWVNSVSHLAVYRE